jgi:hypothetical protein
MTFPKSITCLCLLLLSVPGLQADTVFLTPAEDTFIQGGNRSMDICRTAYLEVAARGASGRDAGLRKIFLAFDVDEDLAAKLVSAKLVLSYRPDSAVISFGEGEKGAVSLELYGGVGEDWSEEYLTWDEAPLHDKARATESGNSLVTLLAEQTADPASPEFGRALTFADDKLADFIRQNPGRFTLIVTCQGGPSMPGLRFQDKDGTRDPELKPTLVLEVK